MYDTNFFIETYRLKNEIIRNSYNLNDAEDIFKKFTEKHSKKPFIFNIETTNYCNMTCKMCQRTTNLQRKLQHMDMDIFNIIVDQLEPQKESDYNKWKSFVKKELSIDSAPSENNFYYDIVSKCITLHGFGEPLLDPMLPERVKLLSDRNIPTYFSCNPNNIRINFIKELFKSGIGYIKFALDSLDDERAKKIRGKLADFSKSYELICKVLKLKKEILSDTVIVITMLDFFGDFSEKSEAKQFLRLWEDKDVYAYVKSIDNRWLLDKKGNKIQGKEKSHYTKQYCEYPWTSMTILANGDVVACTQDINGVWKFGNVKDSSLVDIWNGEKIQAFRKMQITGNYRNDFMCHSNCDQNLISYFLKE